VKEQRDDQRDEDQRRVCSTKQEQNERSVYDLYTRGESWVRATNKGDREQD